MRSEAHKRPLSEGKERRNASDTHLSGLEPPVVEACKIERAPESLNTSMHASMQRPLEFEIAPWLHWHELRFTARSTPTYL